MANIEIPITENGTTTLVTAGKYCDRNIDVNVNTPDRYEDGKQAEYDAFWNAFQKNGERTYYYYGFCGTGWNKDNFKPKYPIKVVGNAEAIFRRFDFHNGDTTNLVDLSPLNIDWSGCTSLQYAFLTAKLEDTGLVDATGCTTLNNTFVNESSGCIKKITLRVHEALKYSTPIGKQPMLTDLIFTEDSVIGNSGWDLSASPLLSKASVQSIINALSSTATGKSITLPTAAKTNHFTDAEWNALVGTKSNWTISLV